MFDSGVLFEENKLSDTVVEFKITSKNKLHPIYIGALTGLVALSLWGMAVNSFGAQGLCILGLLGILAMMKYIVTEESIIVIKNFGIQLRAKYLFNSERTEFLDTDRINSVFIHEFVYGSQIRYGLAFIVKGQDRMSLLFKHLYPGFEHMRRVYQTCKQNL